MLNDFDGLFFRNSSLFIDLFLQGWSVAIFEYQDLEIIVAIDIKAFDQVGAIALIHKARL